MVRATSMFLWLVSLAVFQVPTECRESAATSPEKPVVRIEFLYSVECPHCHNFLRGQISELIEAGLPGDNVIMSMMPLVPPHDSEDTCIKDPLCWKAIAPLCALNQTTHFQWALGDSSELKRVGSFLACEVEVSFPAGRSGTNKDSYEAQTKSCAEKAGITWDGSHGLQRCAFGRKPGLKLMRNSLLAQTMIERYMASLGFTQTPGIPWVFVNGQMLDCNSEKCFATYEAKAEKKLPRAESLLGHVCEQLKRHGITPSACPLASGKGSTEVRDVKLKPCKKCEEDATKITSDRNYRPTFAKHPLAVCPGESRGDHKCNQGSYRVCLQLLNPDGTPKILGKGLNWWQWSNQTDVQWDDAMQASGGDHWCSCGLCVAEAVQKFGCKSLQIQCDATDLAFVEAAPTADSAYQPLKDCILQKCSSAGGKTTRLYSGSIQKNSDHQTITHAHLAGFVVIAAAMAMVVLVVRHVLKAPIQTPLEKDIEDFVDAVE